LEKIDSDAEYDLISRCTRDKQNIIGRGHSAMSLECLLFVQVREMGAVYQLDRMGMSGHPTPAELLKSSYPIQSGNSMPHAATQQDSKHDL